VALGTVRETCLVTRVAHHGEPMHLTSTDTGAPKVRQKLAPVIRAKIVLLQLQNIVEAVMCIVCYLV
jgi:hypothetical protein